MPSNTDKEHGGERVEMTECAGHDALLKLFESSIASMSKKLDENCDKLDRAVEALNAAARGVAVQDQRLTYAELELDTLRKANERQWSKLDGINSKVNVGIGVVITLQVVFTVSVPLVFRYIFM